MNLFLWLVLLIFSSFKVADGQQLIGYNFVSPVHCGGTRSVVSKNNTVLRLLGNGLDAEKARVVLVQDELTPGQDCDDAMHSNPFFLQNSSENSALITINVEVAKNTLFYFCLKSNDSSHFYHQGTSSWLSITALPPPAVQRSTLLHIELQIFIIILLLILSGTFSGLTLGLMSLDLLEIQLLMKTGTPKERQYASMIYPIRARGNFLLCTLLIGNVLVNTTMTVLLDDLTSGATAIVGATIGIVILGEIVPQAFCSRYGLSAGAHTIWLTKFFMAVTFVVSYPFGRFLDFILGQEIRTVYNREKLLELLKGAEEYVDLRKDEVNMIQGALELRMKKVQDVMTPIDNCYMVDISRTLDFKTVTEIVKSGFTRIPVYDREKNNLVSILFVKDLTFVDPDDCMPLKSVSQFYKHPLHFVDPDITLDKVLEQFKTGAFHMAIVRRKVIDDVTKPIILGIITLEDVIEEIIKAEIVDETDVYTDNRRKKLNLARQVTPVDLSLFANNENDGRKPLMSSQHLMAVHRFMMSEIDPFKVMSEKILLMLLKQDVVRVINIHTLDSQEERKQIYFKNCLADFFVLILEGQVKVIVGKENLEFQGGPFSFYGTLALTHPTAGFKRPASHLSSSSPRDGAAEPPRNRSESNLAQGYRPDFDLIATSDLKYVKIARSQYLRAMNATKLSECESLNLHSLRGIDILQDGVRIRKKSDDSSIPTQHYVNTSDYYDILGIQEEDEVHLSSTSIDGKKLSADSAQERNKRAETSVTSARGSPLSVGSLQVIARLSSMHSQNTTEKGSSVSLEGDG